ncbi:MAG: DHA2 family efflux MFS transporter permease subunit [Deltaproteobacteria bacterium]|nr:DHA2 family efflux MFS transporter permease subunit [Deltaproteobacteria bacterium]
MLSLSKHSADAKRRRWWSLSVASIATLIVTSDTGQLSVALPVIITEFNADLTLASWIALVYALITASLYLPCGRMSDLVGVGKLFLVGFIFYALSSLAAGLAQGAGQLIFFRSLQAAGSALIMANNFALVTALFPPEERGRAMGIAGGTISAMGYTLGPVLGGLLTHGFGWRSNFFISAALACVGFCAARVLLPADSFKGSGERKSAFDVAGAIAFALAISLLLYGLTSAQKGGWSTLPVLLPLAAGSAALAFFIAWEKRVQAPLLDLSLFRIPAFTLGNAARLISFIAMSVNILLMPFFLQLAMGLDPLRAGVLIAPMPFAMALLAPLTGWMSERFRAENLCALGMTVTAIAFVFLGFVSPTTAALPIVVCLFFLGFGMGLFQTPNNNLLMSSLPRSRLGVGSSFLSIVRSLGYSVGAALAATVVSAQLGGIALNDLKLQMTAGNGAAGLDAFMRGFHYAYWTAAALCCVGAVISAVRVSKEMR